MNTITKNLIVAAAVGLATTSGLYAGDKAHCHSSSYQKQSACCPMETRVRPLSATVEMFQPGYVQTSKGARLDTADRLAAREEDRRHYTRIVRHDRYHNTTIVSEDRTWRDARTNETQSKEHSDRNNSNS